MNFILNAILLSLLVAPIYILLANQSVKYFYFQKNYDLSNLKSFLENTYIGTLFRPELIENEPSSYISLEEFRKDLQLKRRIFASLIVFIICILLIGNQEDNQIKYSIFLALLTFALVYCWNFGRNLGNYSK